MAQLLLRSYDEIPDGTECHRKTYITTALGGLVGERGPEGGGQGAKGGGRAEGRGPGPRGAGAWGFCGE